MVGQGRSVRAEVLVVFLAAFAFLCFGIWDVPLAAGFTDPVAKVRPQDEALYSSISIGMAERGEWLTPRYMGRLAFVKPILAFLPTALSVKAFGPSRFSLRLFSLLCGAALLTLFWKWAGPPAALLLAANPLFYLLARRNMTDVPVLLAVALAVYWWDQRRASFALAAGILTKSVAGAVPALFLFRGWPRVVGIAALAVLPWHLYQLGVNTDWYWKEHILDEHLQWGLQTPENAAADPHAWFYLTRAWAWDPLLTLAIPVAIAVCLYRKWYREAAWLGVSALTLFLFGYRNATYLLPLFAIAALIMGRSVHWAVAAAVLAVRIFTIPAPEPLPVAPALRAYCEMGRANGLLMYSVADELTASALPIARVQYLLPGDARTLAPTNIDFVGRGIIASRFTGREAPYETVILANSDSELRAILDAANDRDVLLPAHMADRAGSTRDLRRNGDWVIALSRTSKPTSAPSAPRACLL